MRFTEKEKISGLERAGRARRLDHDGIAVIEPFVRLEDIVAAGKFRRHIGSLHGSGGADYPATALPGDVSQAGKTGIAIVPGRVDEQKG